MHPQQARPQPPLYTAEERRRRDASPWTMLQGVLAPVQFIAFLISLVLVLRFLMTGEGLQAATVSVVIKTVLLYTIMVTGSIWEKEVSKFPLDFSMTESAYLLEGEIHVTPQGGDKVVIKAGDFVVFPKGMKSMWEVVKPLRKHYKHS